MRTRPRRFAATDARVHFGEIVDDIADNGEAVEVERSDDFVVVLTPADSTEPAQASFDAKAWWADLDRIHERMRTYRAGKPITEMPEDILRELHDSR